MLDSESGPISSDAVFADQAPAKVYRKKGNTPAAAPDAEVLVASAGASEPPSPAATPAGASGGTAIHGPDLDLSMAHKEAVVLSPSQSEKEAVSLLAQADEHQEAVSKPDPWLDSAPGVGPAAESAAEGAQPVPGITEFPADRSWPNRPSATPAPTYPVLTPDVWGAQELPPSEVAAMPVEEEPEGNYRIGPGDAIDVTVWEMPELSRALFVRPDGFVSFPLIKEVKAAGRTPSQLEQTIAERLSGHLIDPQVSVVVTSVGSKAFYVFGAVANSGAFPYFRQVTLLQAVVGAGGFQSVLRVGQPVTHGDLSRIRIIRTHDTGREVITKNLKDLDSQQILAEDIPIQPEDIIYVPQEAKVAYVFGEVQVPGVIPIVSGARMLDAVLTSGGIRPTGRRDQVLLIRPGTGGTPTTYACVDMKAVERGDLTANLPVQNGDIIYVPQKFIAKVAEFVQLYVSAVQPAMEAYLTSWDAWFVHERFSALRKNDFGVLNGQGTAAAPVNPDP
jgi:polysaccharide export outer membrane protein